MSAKSVLRSADTAEMNGREKQYAPNTIEWFTKFEMGSHPLGSNAATGSPQPEGSGLPERTSVGTAAR